MLHLVSGAPHIQILKMSLNLLLANFKYLFYLLHLKQIWQCSLTMTMLNPRYLALVTRIVVKSL